jgi:hypothetical protein
VPEGSSNAANARRSTAKKPAIREEVSGAKGSSDYVVPVVGLHVPARLVDAGFWGGLAGAVALGAVDPPLGLLVGAGVVIARHRSAA